MLAYTNICKLALANSEYLYSDESLGKLISCDFNFPDFCWWADKSLTVSTSAASRFFFDFGVVKNEL